MKIKKGIHKRQMTKKLSSIIVLLLIVCMTGGMLLSNSSQVMAEDGWIVDPDTHNSWYEGDLGVSNQGSDSTRNTGRVWTDKSVYKDDITLKDINGTQTLTIENDEGTALVGLSALSSAATITGQTTINQPLDIVLVLDRSGSMSEYLYSYSPVYDVSTNETYYVLSADGSYDEANYIRYLRNWYVNGVSVTPMASADDTNFGHVQFYTRSRTTKLAALQMAVNNFIDSVAEQNEGKEEAVQHRIAITSYSTSAKTDSDFTYVSGNHVTSLKRTINGLSASGATYAHEAMANAQNVLENARSDAKKIVIFFTDGEPGYSGWQDSVAGQTVNAAYTMKQDDTTIYSIGVLDGADPTDTTENINRYMNGVSSNYKDAYYTERRNSDFIDELDLGDRVPQDENYYFAAEDADSLNDVFQSIYDSFGSSASSPIQTTETIGGETVGYLTFTDTLGDYTELKNFKAIVFAGQKFTNMTSETSEDGMTTTYIFHDEVDNGDAPGEVYPGKHDLSTIQITVRHGQSVENGDVVEIKIPSSLLPVRLYTATSQTVDGETTTTTDVKDAYPIRFYYTVGIKDEVMDGTNIDASKLEASYLLSHIDDTTGNVYFYSNDYNGDHLGTTTASFVPADTNSFYYYTQDTTLYASQDVNDPASNYLVGKTYYYQRTYYANDQMQTEWVSIVAQEGQLANYVIVDDGHVYIKAGSPRLTRATEFVANKSTNTTNSADQSISPTWNGSEVLVRLGNNAKIQYPISGSLKISKTVDWGTSGAQHNDQEFTYTFDLGGSDVTISGNFNYVKYNAQGQPLDQNDQVQTILDGEEANPTGQIQDGGTLQLSNGEYVIINGLPAKTTFTVTETEVSGYTASNTVGGVASNNGAIASGMIQSNTLVEVAYTNTYTVQPTTLANGTIHGTKVLNGRDWKEGESFTFNLTAVTDGAPLPQGAVGDSVSVTLTNDSNTNYTDGQQVAFQFGEIEYTSVGRYIYLVQESEGSEYGLAYSNAVYRLIVDVTDDGAGHLTATLRSMYLTQTDSGQSTGQDETEWPSIDDHNAIFTNTFSGTDEDFVNITGRKVLNDYTGNQTLDVNDFYFNITEVTPGAPMPEETTTGNLGTGAIEFSDITYGIDDVGKTYEYQIKEVIPSGAKDNGDGTATLNGMTYDATTKTVSVSVTQDPSTGNVVAEVSGNDFVFTNTYRAKEVTTESVSDVLTITKQLDGAAGTDGQFSFTMSAANQETLAAITAGSVTGIDANGNTKTTTEIQKDGSQQITFDQLTFTRPGTYTFNIVEAQNAPNSAWRYDNHTYQVRFEVTDVDGQLVIAQPVTSGSSTFTNTYTASMNYDNEAGGILFSKTLNGRALVANQFNFTVTTLESDQASLDKLAEATTTLSNRYGATAGSSANWRGIAGLTFDQDDIGQTFTFIVSETNANQAGYSYDDKPVTIAISVHDQGDGTLRTLTTVTKDGQTETFDSQSFVSGDLSTYPTAAFVNQYQASSTDPMTVDFEKQLNGREWKDSDVFTFTLAPNEEASTVSGEELAKAMPTQTTATVSGSDASHSFSFGSFTFDKVGTYVYTVTENQPAEGTDTEGVTYCQDVATITFTVTDPGNGQLTASMRMSGIELEMATYTGIFVNTYTAEPVVLEQDTESGLGIQKTVIGAPNQEDFTFVATFNREDEKTTGSIDAIEGLTDGQLSATITEDFVAGQTKAIDFGTVTFKAPGVYVFDVQETNTTTAQGWSYDTATKQIIVTVTDNTTGELVASVDGNDPEFVNRYTSGPVIVGDDEADLQITKTVQGALALEEFTFKVELNTGDVNHVYVAGDVFPEEGITIQSTSLKGKQGSETINFGDITFTSEGTYDFIVTETSETTVSGWTYDQQPRTITVIVSDNDYDGYLEANVLNNNPTIINQYNTDLIYDDPDVLTDGLEVIKKLTGQDLQAGQFEFTLSAKDEISGQKIGLTDGLSKTFTHADAMHDAQGVSMAIMNPLSALSFNQDDAGKTYQYTISEINKGEVGYTYDDTVYEITISITDDGQGTLTATTVVSDGVQSTTYVYNNKAESNGPAQLTFENSYDASESLGGSGSVKINATKTITNRDLVDGEFKFDVIDHQGTTVATGTNAQDSSITFSEIHYTAQKLLKDVVDGIATVNTVNDKNVYTYAYTVKEDASQLDEGVTVIEGSFNIKVNVTDNEDGTLSIAVVYPEGSGDTLIFRNAYGQGSEAVINMSGTKQLLVASGDHAPDITGKYTFTLTGSEGAPMPDKKETTNDAAGNINFGDITFTMENVFGKTVKLTDSDAAILSAQRTKTFTYTITESGQVPGVTNDQQITKTIKVIVTDHGDGTLSVDTDASSDPLFTFENTYSVKPTDPSDPTHPDASGKSAVAITKSLSGRELAAEEFSFVMKDSEGNDVSKATNAVDGSVYFTGITFTSPGTYTYSISEVQGTLGGVSYDTSIYNAQAAVTDNGDGTLSVVWTVFDSDGQKIDSITFANEYTTTSTQVTLGGVKKLTGRALQVGEFSFGLYDEAGNLLQEVQNDANGFITFEALTFEKAGQYRYVISEIAGDDANITYDKTTYTVNVTVQDDGQGHLVASVDGHDIQFVNTYQEPMTPSEPSDNVQTSDNTNIWVWVSLMTVSLGGIGIAYLNKRQKSE